MGKGAILFSSNEYYLRCVIKILNHYPFSPGRLLGNSPVTFTYRNDTRRAPFDPMPDILVHILAKRSGGTSMDILGCENDGKSEESMTVIRSS